MPECAAECVRQSRFSPGVVEDDEPLGRFISHESQLMPDGKALATAAFRISDITTGNGFSLMRLKGVSFDDYEITARRELRRPAGWRPVGVAVAECGSVRALRDESGGRLFCVVDDGLPTFALHSLIRPPEHRRLNRRIARLLRAELMSRFVYRPRGEFFSA